MVGEHVEHAQPKSVTWRDVARAAKVSANTASLALNNHPRVALRTRQRIVEVAARLGYVNNHAARRLARARSQTRSSAVNFDQVGLIYLTGMATDMDPACLAMMRGAEGELARLHAC